MRKSRKSLLVDGLRSDLLPELQRRGFELFPLSGDAAGNQEFRRSFPFGLLRRKSNFGLEQIEVQIHKRGTAAFRLNFGTIPPNGISHRLGHTPPEDCWVGWLEVSYAAYQNPLLHRWFRPSCWPWETFSQMHVNKLMPVVINVISEVERALCDGYCGPHIRRIYIPRQHGSHTSA